jgi:hypothetical protein
MRFLVGEGANSIKWANSNDIDLILHMDYSPAGEVKKEYIDNAIKTLIDKKKFVLMIGNYEASKVNRSITWSRSAGEVINLLKYSLAINNGTKNTALYELRFLDDEQAGEISQLFNTPPSSPAKLNIVGL